jgi:hypothetical protein
MLRKLLMILVGLLVALVGLLVALIPGINPAVAQDSATNPSIAQAAPTTSICPPANQTLQGVDSPDRLLVLNPCQTVTGYIDASRLPQYFADDGDIHNQFTPDPQYQNLLTNQQETPGNLVVEIMDRDAGHLPVLPVGSHLTLMGAYVYDTGHAWTELHPVFGVCVEGGSCYTSGPQYGGTPPGSTGNPMQTCRTQTGQVCPGYNGQVPTYKQVTGSSGAT